MLKTVLILSCCLALTSLGFSHAGPPVVISAGQGDRAPRQPRIAIAEDGRIFAAFGIGEEVWIATSDAAGQSFTEARRIAHVPKLALGMRRGPRITVSGKALTVSAISHQTGSLIAWTSEDWGGHWSDGVVVNTVPRSAREGLHAMANGPDGSVFLVWLDLRSGTTEVYISKSEDQGKSWSENSLVYRSPSGSVCECCHPSIAVGRDGRVRVMWRNLIQGQRDMYIAESVDGLEFGEAQKLGIGNWTLPACPMDGGDLAVTGEGKNVAVWRRNKTVYLTSDQMRFEKTIQDGEQPVIACDGNDPWILWLKSRGGSLQASGPMGVLEAPLSTNANDPVICTGGGEPKVVAAWEDASGDTVRLLMQTLNR